MRHAVLASLVIGLLSLTAWAQEEGEQGQERGGQAADQQRPERPGRRERGMAGQRGGRDRQRGGDRMFARIADELELDAEQRARFEEIAAKQRERMSELEDRWREAQEAGRNGDEEQAAQLRAELREARGPESGLAEALEELEPILRDDQLSKLWELQDRMQSRQNDRDRYRRITEELPDELGLSDEQRDEFQELLRTQREQRRVGWGDIRPLMEEMRAAREAGDDQRVQELRRQLEEARPSQEAMFEGLFKELQDMLTEEQLQRLVAFREELTTGGRGGQGGPEDVRNVLRAVKRLRLEDDQKEKIREIEREAIGAYRKISRQDKDEQTALATETKAEIMKVLNEEQGKEFENALKRVSGGRGDREQRRDRGERRERPRRGEREP
jgi:hypothetical protein